MTEPSKYLITSALPYSNGDLHVGHLAGAYLPADIYARHLRSMGKDVAFICGSDEYGAAITLRAKKDGKTPKEIVDYYHERMRKAFEAFGISFDHYTRTTSDTHAKLSTQFFLELHDAGQIVKKKSMQLFDEQEQVFLADRYVTGTCPKCDQAGAYGDQCEKCGTLLNATSLVNPVSTLSGTTPALKETEHWYLPLGDSQEVIRRYINKGEVRGYKHHDPREWKSNVMGQVSSWLSVGLGDRPITRDLDWGITVPLEGWDNKVLYVWFDAPIGYITATAELAVKRGIVRPDDETVGLWQEWWCSPSCKLVQFVGKDNIVFHTVMFPAVLSMLGLILPHNVPANEFMTLEGMKISTSKNWGVWLNEYLEDFPGRTDELRYYLTAIMPETGDSEFIWQDFASRVNNELAAVFGNFVNRAFALVVKYCSDGFPEEYPDDVVLVAEGLVADCANNIEQFRFHEALSDALGIARLGNKYITDSKPWEIYKTDPEGASTIVAQSIEIVRLAALTLEPFIPESAGKVIRAVENREFSNFPILFPMITPEEVEAQRNKLFKSLV